MAWYDTGTVSVTNGSTAVVGSGTDFISAKVQVGEAFYGPDGKIYEIAAIVSSTSLTLADNYLGTTQSGQTYKIVPTQSLVADLATNVSTLITDFANVRDLAGEGKFDDGTVAAPGITFNLDQDNGLYRIGANNWAMAVGGSKIVDLTSTGIDVTGTVTADGLTVLGTDTTLVASIGTDAQRVYITPDGTEINYNASGNSAGSHMFQTGNVNRLNIASNGDISFYEDTGTTAKLFWDASAESLTVTGGIISNGQVPALTASSTFSDYIVGYNKGRFAVVGDAIGTAGEIVFSQYSSNGSVGRDVVTIDSSGNVGIGESSPINLSDYVGLTLSDTTGGFIRFKNDAGTQAAQIAASASSLQIETIPATPIIFYTNSSEAMRIDASGRLIVGHTSLPWPQATSSASITAGMIQQNGTISATTDQESPLYLNRTTDDGALARFYKDGAPVGSIASTDGTDLQIGSGNCYLRFDDADNKILPTNAAGAKRDNVLDLGHTDARFGDLYLSGTANVGSQIRLNAHSGYDERSIGLDSTGLYIYNVTDARYDLSIDGSGNLLVGTTSSSARTEIRCPNTTETTSSLLITNSSAAGSVYFFNAAGTGVNTSASAFWIEKNTVSNRSINAGGTINASGTDYAEYEHNNGLVISKGSIVGFKADGTLTLTFSDSVRFAIKSTDPSYVGGDTWARLVGNRPVKPADSDQEVIDQYEADLAEFEAALEAARVLVDRIAYSGKVPVNIQGANAGDYIIAVASEDGSITGQAVSDPDFSQYKLAVGRVNRVLEDGRAEVAVIIH